MRNGTSPAKQRWRSESKALALAVVGLFVVLLAGGSAVYYDGTLKSVNAVVPEEAFTLASQRLGGYWTSFEFQNSATASYRVTGVWESTAPTQVIIAEELGANYGGCGSNPLNFGLTSPNGAYMCLPGFTATQPGSFSFTFHICVLPQYLPTGSFLVIFRSTAPASVMVTQPFLVYETGFPESSCPSP